MPEPSITVVASEPIPPQLETLIQEIQQTPLEQWGRLLEILRIFRQSVTVSSDSVGSDSSETRVNQAKPINQAALDLLRTWREDGDEVDQRETWEFLQQALEDDRLSNRPLFPPS